MGIEEPSDELVPGTLAMLTLKTLSRGEAMHRHAIADSIQQSSSDILRVEEGALHRRAKHYSLTTAGRLALEQEAASWRRITAASRES